jgi:hypothetical protein
VIEAVVPSPHQTIACRGLGIDGPSGESCTMIVKGDTPEVAKRIADSLARAGYRTFCTNSSLGLGGVVVVGYKPGMRVLADVIPRGFVLVIGTDAVFEAPGTRIDGTTTPMPAGSVGLAIDASEYATTVPAGSSCDRVG